MPTLQAEMGLRERIVERFLRQAGQFDAPPKIYRLLADWVTEVYASHVLALVEASLERTKKPTKMREAQKLLQEYKAQGATAIRNLKDGKRVRFYSVTKDIKVTNPLNDFVVERQGDQYRRGDAKGTRVDWWSLLPLPKLLELFNGWLEQQTSRLELEQSRGYTQGLDQKAVLEVVVELNLIRQECLKYTSEAKLRANKVEQSFRLTPEHFQGWKYLNAPVDVEDNIAVSSISAALYFRKSLDASGVWYALGNKVELDMPSKRPLDVRDFRVKLTNVLNTLYHEVQHTGQSFLKRIKQLKEEAGLPGKRLRDPDYKVEGVPTDFKSKGWGLRHRDVRRPHELRDVEFYTNLTNDVQQLKKDLGRVAPDVRQEQFNRFVDSSRRMKSLKKDAPLKWQKAVSELYKAMTDAGLF